MRAVFLDRDGVINENRLDHVKSWAEFRFLPGALDAMARLARADVKVFVITNQAIVNRGVVSREVVEAINRRMIDEVERGGGRIAGVAYCPHRPDERCGCRKPNPGLLIELAREHGLDLKRTVLIGDALTDIQAGQAAGCETVLVLTGRGQAQLPLIAEATCGDVAVATDLDDAVNRLLRRPASVA
jgi:D-glycero-D-manno-heptose 1,7-bisphosphate phosphatase